MPYIKIEDRGTFVPMIEESIRVILSEENDLTRAEMLGWWCSELVRQFQGYTTPSNHFSAHKFDTAKRAELLKQVRIINSVLATQWKPHKQEYFKIAGVLHYLLAAVLWGVLGDAEDASPARYGFRSFVNAMLWDISENDVAPLVADSEIVRYRLMLRGVLSDVILEIFRKKQTPYEMEKEALNGDVWREGKLVGKV